MRSKNPRTDNYWEPTYDRKWKPSNKVYDWAQISTNVEPHRVICEEINFSSISMKSINDKKFIECDFRGAFITDSTIFTFKTCNFEGCHFSYSQSVKVTIPKMHFYKMHFWNCNFY